jgi:HK97 family phage prohead protease
MDSKISIRGAVLRADDNSRVITFRASTPAIDRHGTRVRTEGIDTTSYETNAVFGWAHDLYGSFLGSPQLSHVLGRTVAIRKTSQALDIDVEFAPAEVNPLGDQAFRMVKGKFLNAVSIGFIPKDIVIEMHDGIEVPVITKSELLEVSLVSIPSNSEALALTREFDQQLFIDALKHKKSSTPPAPAADPGVVIDAFTEWQIRRAFQAFVDSARS